ncbi:FAD-dependent oxidoreductase [Allorhizocola rhizosphaerae]|uniref:FAD-dependent oxidoreductase n=1 Tax=Allorhizocola rhizosphaerae TaxID=1872709 RepID=UPI000E3B8F95|nr:FAD-dependent oxidoreductase [Allorhizocola rhizosphaerae]
MSTSGLPVAVIGAGPVGMAGAAQLAARAMPFVVVEAGDTVAASIRQWAHVRLFTPWRLDTDPAARALLEATGWAEPDPDDLPSGRELIDGYLAPLAAHPSIAPHIRYRTRVIAVARAGFDRVRTAGREHAPFVLRLSDGTELLAGAVIDASGTWRSPNPVGGNGLPAYGETEARHSGRIFDGMPDVQGNLRAHFAGKTVAVVGAGHSAIGTLLSLADLADETADTAVQWVLRALDPSRAYGDGASDALPARGSIGTAAKKLVEEGKIAVHTGFFVDRITDEGLVSSDGRTVKADVIVNATGARPHHAIADELRLDIDPILGSTRALAPLIDPNVHSCQTVPRHGVDELAHPEQGFYIIGAKSYGRARTFLLATGYEQARSVVAALDGDWEAARAIQVDLTAGASSSSDSVCGPASEAADVGCGAPASVASEADGSKANSVCGPAAVSFVEIGSSPRDSRGGCN